MLKGQPNDIIVFNIRSLSVTNRKKNLKTLKRESSFWTILQQIFLFNRYQIGKNTLLNYLNISANNHCHIIENLKDKKVNGVVQ